MLSPCRETLSVISFSLNDCVLCLVSLSIRNWNAVDRCRTDQFGVDKNATAVQIAGTCTISAAIVGRVLVSGKLHRQFDAVNTHCSIIHLYLLTNRMTFRFYVFLLFAGIASTASIAGCWLLLQML